uniref:Uncharacterized protein n=1 Tax=Anopheles quadriannulatus TaxID=34691 RepID=A0A182XQT7_ANOQN
MCVSVCSCAHTSCVQQSREAVAHTILVF